MNIRDNIALLVTWVDEYYRKRKKTSTFGGKKYSYYGSLRGYFKHSSILTDVLEKELFGVEYKIWFRMISNVKSGHEPVSSGGLFFKYEDYDDLCGKRNWQRCRKKFIDLNILIETPFKDYYVVNTQYIVKMYNPKEQEEETKKEE